MQCSFQVARRWSAAFARGRALLCTSVRFGSNEEDVSELMERHVANDKHSPVPPATRTVPSTRTHALHLYRTILRYSALFSWVDDHGVAWTQRLRQSARSEFEAARNESDPEVIARLILTSRESVDKVMEKLLEKRDQLQKQGKLGHLG